MCCQERTEKCVGQAAQFLALRQLLDGVRWQAKSYSDTLSVIERTGDDIERMNHASPAGWASRAAADEARHSILIEVHPGSP